MTKGQSEIQRGAMELLLKARGFKRRWFVRNQFYRKTREVLESVVLTLDETGTYVWAYSVDYGDDRVTTVVWDAGYATLQRHLNSGAAV